MTAANKDLIELTWDELIERGTAVSGLPPPPRGAPSEDWHQWGVATVFLCCCDAMATPDAGKLFAANELLVGPQAAALIPYVEKAIGRRLTMSEIAARRIESVGVSGRYEPDRGPLDSEALDLLA